MQSFFDQRLKGLYRDASNLVEHVSLYVVSYQTAGACSLEIVIQATDNAEVHRTSTMCPREISPHFLHIPRVLGGHSPKRTVRHSHIMCQRTGLRSSEHSSVGGFRVLALQPQAIPKGSSTSDYRD